MPRREIIERSSIERGWNVLKLHLSLPRLIFAFALIVVGAAYLFQALGMMPHPVIYYGYHYGWALGFLVFGLWQIPRSFLACLLYLALSAVFFLRGAGYLHYSLMTYALDDGWPICLFVFGVWLAGKSIKNAIFRREFGGLLLFLFGLIDAGIGAGLLLDQFHIIVFNYGRFYELVWPVALMIFGVSFLFGGRVGRRRVARKKENHESFTDEEPEGAIVGLYRHEQAISQDFKRPMKKEGFLIGDFKLGGSEAWTFEDTSVWHAIGDVGVDLRQAVFDERESQIGRAHV